MEPRHGAGRRTLVDSAWARTRLLAVSSLVLLCVSCGGTSNADGTSSASCVGPYLNGTPPGGALRGPVPTVSPGASLTIHGHWYTDTCNDTGGHDPLTPLPPVHLILTLPGGTAQTLGPFHPHGQDLGFSLVVHVPAGTRTGAATVRDDRRPPATYRFRVGR